MQLNIMNSRVIALVAQDKDRWQWPRSAFFEMDLSAENLPPNSSGNRSAVIESHASTSYGCKNCVAFWARRYEIRQSDVD